MALLVAIMAPDFSTSSSRLTKRSPFLVPNPLHHIKALKYAIKGGIVFLFPPAWKKLPFIIAKKLKSWKKAKG